MINIVVQVIMGLKTAYETFNFSYLFKVDTDTFVHVVNLHNYLLYFNNEPNVYVGAHG